MWLGAGDRKHPGTMSSKENIGSKQNKTDLACKRFGRFMVKMVLPSFLFTRENPRDQRL